MPGEAFFRRERGRFVPTPAAAGVWSADSLHGRAIGGLLGSEIERRHLPVGQAPTRLTLDMYAVAKAGPVEIRTQIVRDGRRIRLVQADFASGGQPVARATCMFLQPSEPPSGSVWTRPNWDAPPPAEVPPAESRRLTSAGLWALRPISGTLGQSPRQGWMAEVRDLVEGDPLTPFARAALAADYVNPAANGSDAGLGYINSDLTLYLHREAVSEWIGVEVIDHSASRGSRLACSMTRRARSAR